MPVNRMSASYSAVAGPVTSWAARGTRAAKGSENHAAPRVVKAGATSVGAGVKSGGVQTNTKLVTLM